MVLPSIDTWQLIINTATTIVTFLLVALLQNTQKRADDAAQEKLNAIADGLSDLMDKLAVDHPELRDDRLELRKAVGLEDRESAEDRVGHRCGAVPGLLLGHRQSLPSDA